MRANAKGISEKTCEQDITAGIVSKETLDSYKVLLSELYLPIFQEQSSWGKSSEEHTRAFLQVGSHLFHAASLPMTLHAFRSQLDLLGSSGCVQAEVQVPAALVGLAAMV